MGWKMFGLRRRFGSPKEEVFKVFSLIRAIGKRDLNASSDAHDGLRQPHGFNPQAYIIVKQRMHEIEGQKAMIIHELRARGPV